MTETIVTWKSEDAPAECRWMARIMVPVKECKKQSKREGRDGPHAVQKEHEEFGRGKPDKMGFLPILHYGKTKEHAIARTERFWAKQKADKAAKRVRAMAAPKSKNKESGALSSRTPVTAPALPDTSPPREAGGRLGGGSSPSESPPFSEDS
ncbi:MAG: hypothetical protein GY807_24075 [Gammaproteobacteria bacterium]|nr:hypothetical protein [Gammaproteobacteria bacterium]